MNIAEHEYFMKLCLDLAKKGSGCVSPNPLVGAVVVKQGKILGTGYHKKFGGPHAEVFAINKAGKEAKDSDLYINLEPCSHHGKTPPCVDLIIEKKIKRVIIANRDPNPLVNGKGVKKLKEAGIEVIEDVLKSEGENINEAFFKYIKDNIPFVVLKIAQTIDGKIADYKGKSRWISNVKSQKLVHKLRSEYDAVLVGANTVRLDNPELIVRMVKGRNPARVILDGNLTLNHKYKVFSNLDKSTTYLVTSRFAFMKHKRKVKRLIKAGVKFIILSSKNPRLNLKTVLKKLAQLNIASLLVEGGSVIFTQFLEKKLADKIYIIISSKILGNGVPCISKSLQRSIKSPILLSDIETIRFSDDFLIKAKIKY